MVIFFKCWRRYDASCFSLKIRIYNSLFLDQNISQIVPISFASGSPIEPSVLLSGLNVLDFITILIDELKLQEIQYTSIKT